MLMWGAFAAVFLGGAGERNSDTPRMLSLNPSSDSQLGPDIIDPVMHRGSLPSISMPVVLSIFNGSRTLSEALALLPRQLAPYGLDMVVWLLRRRMLFCC